MSFLAGFVSGVLFVCLLFVGWVVYELRWAK
jgi:hypothetical protein